MTFADDDHALRCGMVIGTFMQAGLNARLLTDDEGNFLDTIELIISDTADSYASVILKVMP